MLQVFNFISSVLQTTTGLTPEWFNQQMDENEVMQAPALYIEFTTAFEWQDYLNRFQRADIEFCIYAVTEAPETGFDRFENVTMADHLDLVKNVALALHRKQITLGHLNIDNINRRRTLFMHELTTFQVTKTWFSCTVIDTLLVSPTESATVTMSIDTQIVEANE